MYTARIYFPEIASYKSTVSGELKALFELEGAVSCYMFNENLLVHFDSAEDLTAWTLRWDKHNIIDAVNKITSKTLDSNFVMEQFTQAQQELMKDILWIDND